LVEEGGGGVQVVVAAEFAQAEAEDVGGGFGA